MSFRLFLALSVISTFLACEVSPGFSDIPELTYVGISDNSMDQGSVNNDSIFLYFDFKDGDGDIGLAQDAIPSDLILTDSRTGGVFDRFKLPEIPPAGAANGIEGSVELKVYTTCCIFEDGIPPCSSPLAIPRDTLVLDIQLTDQAGNESNIIQTDQIIIFCN